MAIHPWMDGRNRTPHSLQELAGDRHHAPSPFSAPTTLTVIVMIKGPRKRPTFLPLWPPLWLENHDYNSPFFWWAFRNRVRGAREHTHVRRSAPVSCRYLPSRGRGKNRAFSARHEENGALYDGNASSSLRSRSIRTLVFRTKDEPEPSTGARVMTLAITWTVGRRMLGAWAPVPWDKSTARRRRRLVKSILMMCVPSITITMAYRTVRYPRLFRSCRFVGALLK